MKDLLDKITSYNLLNYLLPGVVFVSLAKEFTDYDLVQDKELIGAFLYYFIGLVISRFGSLLMEPLMKRFKFITMYDYKEFVTATKADEKIELLSEANNTYRTLASMLLLLGIVKCYNLLQVTYFVPQWCGHSVLSLLLFFLFLLSYRKQTNYITKRIAANKNL